MQGGKKPVYLRRIEVGLETLADTIGSKIAMDVGNDAMTSQCVADAEQRTAVDCDDRTPRFSNTNKRPDVAADAGNTRHLRIPPTVKPKRQMVGELCGARASRARVHERKL